MVTNSQVTKYRAALRTRSHNGAELSCVESFLQIWSISLRQLMTVRLATFKKNHKVANRGLIQQVVWLLAGLPILRSRWLPGAAWRVVILRLCGAKIGSGVKIKTGVRIKYPWRLRMGNDCWIGEDC